MKLTDRTYTFLKYLTMIALPAIGTLYFALAQIWDLPYAEQITGTITAVVTFLGALLGISSAKYYTEADEAYAEEEGEIDG